MKYYFMPNIALIIIIIIITSLGEDRKIKTLVHYSLKCKMVNHYGKYLGVSSKS